MLMCQISLRSCAIQGLVITLVNLARSAVSAYLNPSGSTPLGSHPVVCRLMKGVFENRPSLLRYNETKRNCSGVFSRMAGHRAAHVERVNYENSNVTGPTFRSKGTINPFTAWRYRMSSCMLINASLCTAPCCNKLSL